MHDFQLSIIELLNQKGNISLRDWINRHFFQSAKSGYKFSELDLNRLSVIRDLGDTIAIVTNIVTDTEHKVDLYYLRFWSSLLDWELLDKLDERNDVLIELANKYDKNDVVRILKTAGTRNIVHPEELDGYRDLSSSDRMFLKIIFIHSFFPNEDLLLNDFNILNGVGAAKAKKYIKEGLMLPEDVMKNYNIFLFHPNKNHLQEFQSIIEQEVSKTHSKKFILDYTISGSFGRGNIHGHDIDVLVHENSKKNFLMIMDDISNVILTDKSYTIVLLDTLVRIDVNFYNNNDRITQKMHYFGPKEFNIWLRQKAKSKGYSLNQYGLTNTNNNKIKHPSSEQELYDVLEIISPEIDGKTPREKWWMHHD